MGVEAGAETSAAVAQAWTTSGGLLGAKRAMTWSRRREASTNSAARADAFRHAGMVPLGQTVTLRVTIQAADGETDPEVWDFPDAVITAAVPVVERRGAGGAVMWTFRAVAGKAVPVSGIPLVSGLPISWHLVPLGEIDDLEIGEL